MKLIVSLTSISSRISKLQSVIESLLAQKPFSSIIQVHIRIFISRDPYLLDSGISEVPGPLARLISFNSALSSSPRISLEYSPNYGPHRKYYIAFDELDEDDILVTVDDDTLYPFNFLETIVNCIGKYKCVVAMRGRRVKLAKDCIDKYNRWGKDNEKLGKPSLFNVGTGKDGIAYKKHYLHPSCLDIQNALKFANKGDDLWLKAHSLLALVPTVVINPFLKNEFPSVSDDDKILNPSLYSSYNKSGGNDQTMSSINKYLMAYHHTSWLDLIRRER